MINSHICKNKIKKSIFKLKTDHEIIEPFISKNSKILDFGCNDCTFFDSLKGMKKLIGCDINKNHLDKARKKGYEVYSSINEIKEKFDFITLNEVIEHLSLEETEDFLKKIQLLLNKKAKLIISTPNPNEIYTKLEDDPNHKRLYFINELKNLGEKNNFKTLKVIKHHIRVNPLKILKNLIKRKDPHSGYTIIMEFQE